MVLFINLIILDHNTSMRNISHIFRSFFLVSLYIQIITDHLCSIPIIYNPSVPPNNHAEKVKDVFSDIYNIILSGFKVKPCTLDDIDMHELLAVLLPFVHSSF